MHFFEIRNILSK